MTDDLDGWRGRAAALAEGLARQNAITDSAWREAVAAVPRHVFVPAFHDDEAGVVRAGDLRWLDAVYSDDTLVTQRKEHDGSAWSTSSTTRPSLMLRMLELLDVSDGMTVLEIGTGTGYNAALLSERLGSPLVTSIDVDGTLVSQAREALEAAGYRPTVATMDGAQGYPPNAPYQRILATCGLGRVPSTWLDQLDEGGLILANVGLGMALLRKGPDGHARGRFLPDAAGFMRLRSISLPGVPTLDRVLSVTAGEPERVHREAEVPGLDDHAMAEFLLSLLLPYGLRVVQHKEGSEVHCVLDGASGAWWRAEVDAEGRTTVDEGGGHSLWASYRALLRAWDEAGRPEIGRYGLTVAPDGRHHLWLDRPDAAETITLDVERT